MLSYFKVFLITDTTTYITFFESFDVVHSFSVIFPCFAEFKSARSISNNQVRESTASQPHIEPCNQHQSIALSDENATSIQDLQPSGSELIQLYCIFYTYTHLQVIYFQFWFSFSLNLYFCFY